MRNPSLALRAQAERARAVEELRAQGFSMGATWALIQQRQKRREQRMREPWALPHQARVPHQQQAVRPDPSRWAMLGAAAIVAAFVGIAAGVGWLVVHHGPKVLGRLGF
jgi:hypothetical protein